MEEKQRCSILDKQEAVAALEYVTCLKLSEELSAEDVSASRVNKWQFGIVFTNSSLLAQKIGTNSKNCA